MGKFFLKFFFAPFVYVQNDERVMGIMLRFCVLGYPLTPL